MAATDRGWRADVRGLDRRVRLLGAELELAQRAAAQHVTHIGTAVSISDLSVSSVFSAPLGRGLYRSRPVYATTAVLGRGSAGRARVYVRRIVCHLLVIRSAADGGTLAPGHLRDVVRHSACGAVGSLQHQTYAGGARLVDQTGAHPRRRRARHPSLPTYPRQSGPWISADRLCRRRSGQNRAFRRRVAGAWGAHVDPGSAPRAGRQRHRHRAAAFAPRTALAHHLTM